MAIKKIKTASAKCLNKNAHSKCYSKPISFAIANLPVISCHKPPVISCHKPPCDFLSHKSLSLRNRQKAGIVRTLIPPLVIIFAVKAFAQIITRGAPSPSLAKSEKTEETGKNGDFEKKGDFRKF